MQEHPLSQAQRWFAQAAADLDSARYSSAGGRFSLACFLSQQAVEKAIKALLIWRKGDYPRQHVIFDLLAELKKVDADAAIRLADAGTLDQYYQTTRYPDAIGGAIPAATFHDREAELAIARATEALVAIREMLPPNDSAE